MTISNSDTLLKDLVDKIVDLKNQIVDHAEFRKEKVKELKKFKVPVAELIRVAKQDIDKQAEKAKNIQDAAGILGVEVYAGSVTPDRPKEFADDVMDHTATEIEAIVKIDEDVKAANEEIKGHLKELESAGFVPSIVRTIVDIKMDPKGYENYSSNSALVEAYWKAVAA